MIAGWSFGPSVAFYAVTAALRQLKPYALWYYEKTLQPLHIAIERSAYDNMEMV